MGICMEDGTYDRRVRVKEWKVDGVWEAGEAERVGRVGGGIEELREELFELGGLPSVKRVMRDWK